MAIVTFDTSAHNRLAKDGSLSEAILAGLKSGMFFRCAGLAIEEMVSHPNSSDRAKLFAYCAKLQDGPHDCLHAHNYLVKYLVIAHHQNPATFNWKTVNVRSSQDEKWIRQGKSFSDALSAQQKEAQYQREKEYKKMFSDLRPKLERIFANHGGTPPSTFRQAIIQVQNSEINLILEIGKLLYDTAAKTDASEATIANFIDVCPPFRALVYANLMSWYDISVRDRHNGEKFKAGRNDLFMSVYLPYCDKFITDERERKQEKCLREIVAVTHLETEIMSYDDFCNSFLVAA